MRELNSLDSGVKSAVSRESGRKREVKGEKGKNGTVLLIMAVAECGRVHRCRMTAALCFCYCVETDLAHCNWPGPGTGALKQGVGD